MRYLRRFLIVLVLAVAEVGVIHNNLRAAPLAAFFVRPVTNLEPAGNYRYAALAEILAEKLCRRSLGHAVNKIGVLFIAIFLVVSVTGQREAAYRSTALGSAQLWIADQPTHEYDMIQHSKFLLNIYCNAAS